MGFKEVARRSNRGASVEVAADGKRKNLSLLLAAVLSSL